LLTKTTFATQSTQSIAMMLLQDAPAKIKIFLKPLQATSMSNTTRAYLVRLVIGFLFHMGRMSASQAAETLRGRARHRAQVARFLADCRWSKDWTECLWMATLLLQQELATEPGHRGRWVFILDQTYCSQQGAKTENTYSTGNRKRRPAKGRRYSKKKHARRPCTVSWLACC
jgi:hypothetical protein